MPKTSEIISEALDKSEKLSHQVYEDVAQNGGLTSDKTLNLANEVRRVINRLDNRLGL